MLASEKYKNFVRASQESATEDVPVVPRRFLSGIDARRIYLDVVSQPDRSPSPVPSCASGATKNHTKHTEKLIQSDNQLFLAAQNNDHEALRTYLSVNKDKINVIDEYGWSLLMIACQANSVQTVKVLLKLNVDTSTRDKAGNSANSLLIKQKNVELIDIMLNHKSKQKKHRKEKRRNMEPYECAECNKTFRDKAEHLSSTVHNINLSKGKKVRPWYGIPESNRGYQILIKSGWDIHNGLGPDGTGKKYPIKPVMKQDRKGLGVNKKKTSVEKITEDVKRNKRKSDNQRDRAIEKNFRREFYDVSH